MSAVKIIAHRGASADAPENTMAAFLLGVDQGCEMIELDIHLTKDKQIVVIHDATLDRTTSGSGNVADMAYEELQTADAGSWFDEQFAGEKVSLLEDVLSTVPAHVAFNVEIKSSKEEQICARLLDVLKRTNRLEQTVISSFDFECLAQLQKLDRSMKVGLLYSSEPVDYMQVEQDLGMEIYSLHPQYHLVNEEYMAAANKHGKVVFPWTVDGKEDLERMMQLGVSGIITNKPGFMGSLRR